MTLKALYQQQTGDLASHQRAIDALFRRLHGRARNILRGRLEGLSLREIAANHKISHGSVAGSIARSLESIRKKLAGEPRHNRSVKPAGRQPRSRTRRKKA